MQEKKDGATYAPKGKAQAVVKPGEFKVGVIGLDHGHIYGMCNGLSEDGAQILKVWDNDSKKVEAFCKQFPTAIVAKSEEEVLNGDFNMIACASVASDRGKIGLKAMELGKDFFADKPSITTLEDLEALRSMYVKTGKRFFTYFSERLHVEASVYAEKLLNEGAIGKVIQVMGWGPHRIGPEENRPQWFWHEKQFGGILCDIGCHQIEQLMFFSGAKDAKIISSRVGN